MRTRGQNKALARRQIRAGEKRILYPGGKMMGAKARRGWGDGRADGEKARGDQFVDQEAAASFPKIDEAAPVV